MFVNVQHATVLDAEPASILEWRRELACPAVAFFSRLALMTNLIMAAPLAEPVVCPLRELRGWFIGEDSALRFLLKLACVKTVITDAL